MFATPQWEPDVPSTNIQFQKFKKKKEATKSGAKVRSASTQNNKKNALTSTPNSPQKQQNKAVNKTYPGQFVRISNVKTSPNLNKKVLQPFKTKIPDEKKNNDSKNLTNKTSKFEKKPEKSIKKKRKLPNSDNLDNINDSPDNVVSKTKKRKLNRDTNENQKQHLSNDSDSTITKVSRKKEKFKKILELGNRTSIKPKSTLREKMMEKLKAAQFRYLNEKLYTSTGTDAMQLFQNDPAAFNTYHEGYQLQLKKWPINPLDVIVKRISKMPKTSLIADMGCGEGLLSSRVPHTVRSFDLVSTAPGVESCDMAKTPLLSASIDVAVYCLSLMGTDLTKYLIEANRILKVGGIMLVAEVESRFDNVDTFIADVQRLGFTLLKLDKSHEVFLFMEFKKNQDTGRKSKKPVLSLKPCLYKRR